MKNGMKCLLGFMAVSLVMTASNALADVRMVEGLKVTRETTVTCEECLFGPSRELSIRFMNEGNKLYRVRKVSNSGGNATAEMTRFMVSISSDAGLQEKCTLWDSYFIYSRRGGLIGWVPCSDSKPTD